MIIISVIFIVNLLTSSVPTKYGFYIKQKTGFNEFHVQFTNDSLSFTKCHFCHAPRGLIIINFNIKF